MKNFALSLLAAGTALVALGAPAAAAVPVSDGQCSFSDISPTASACVGYFPKNILNNNQDNLDAVSGALSALLGKTVVLTKTQMGLLPNLSPLGGADADFGAPPSGSSNIPTGFKLYGDTVVGIHWGNGQGGGNVSSFYRFNAGKQGLAVLDILRAQGATSNLVVFQTGIAAVPEPASWAMMIGGMGFVGASMRRRSAKMSFA